MVSERHSCTRGPGSRAGLGLVLAASLALSACQSMGGLFGGATDTLTTGSIDHTNSAFDQTTRLAQTWESDPSDISAALAYADALKRLGSLDRSISVLREAASLNPDSRELHDALGRHLVAAGQLNEASEALYTAISLGGAGWQLYSLQGTVLDRMGQHTRAREYYAAALQGAPNEPAVINNQAMSYALEGAPERAEEILRDGLSNVSEGEGATTMRQNLALVLGLQGRFEDARALLAQDLSPAQVEANIVYIRSIVSQPNTWAQLQAIDG